MTSDSLSLKLRLTNYASAWAVAADDYRRDRPHAHNIERAFCLGMSTGFEESCCQLLKLLAEPTVQTVFTLLPVLEQYKAQAAQYHAELEDQPSLSAYTLGVAEGYKICVEYLNGLLVETMLSANTRIDYPC